MLKTNRDQIDALFKDALYKILDWPPHATQVAVYRELGWEGLEFYVAQSKIGLLQRIAPQVGAGFLGTSWQAERVRFHRQTESTSSYTNGCF
jgi:hypothetical protein